MIASLPAAVKAAGLVGPRFPALAACPKGDCPTSYTTIQRFWNEILGIPISRGPLVNVVQKVSAAFETPYDELREALVEQPYVGVDESGHKNRGNKLLPWVRQLLETWHRAESLAAAGFGRAMDRIRRGFLKAARRPPQPPQAQNLADRFRGAEADNYFRFLTMPGIEPTTNQTEQAIRHLVMDRPITQCTRGTRGQQWRQRVWTILATGRQQKCRVFEFCCQAINAHRQQQAAPSLRH